VTRLSLVLLIALLMGAPAYAQIDHITTPGVQWNFGQRSWLYTLLPNEMTALQIQPHPLNPPVIGTQAELTIYRTKEWGATAPREFFNILTATGFSYDSGRQNDHQVRFGMETAFGGKHIPVYFCFEAPQGQAADCPLRIYGGDNAHKGVWICKAEGDCKDLLKFMWEPQVIQVIQVEPVQTIK
jgi:hypothetical protein